jgi:hypothetical protein
MNMDEMKKDGLLDGRGESNTDWITLKNGVHVPIKDWQTEEEAVNEFVGANEFRRITNAKIDKEQHPSHIYAKNNRYAKLLSLTTHPKDKGETKDAILLRENPNSQDNRPSYFIPKSKTVKHEDLSQALNKWKLHKSDDLKMKKYRDAPFDQ